MDPADWFYQEMDSKDLLDHHGPRLRVEAMKFLAEHPDARVGAIIVTHDAREAGRPAPADCCSCRVHRTTHLPRHPPVD